MLFLFFFFPLQSDLHGSQGHFARGKKKKKKMTITKLNKTIFFFTDGDTYIFGRDIEELHVSTLIAAPIYLLLPLLTRVYTEFEDPSDDYRSIHTSDSYDLPVQNCVCTKTHTDQTTTTHFHYYSSQIPYNLTTTFFIFSSTLLLTLVFFFPLVMFNVRSDNFFFCFFSLL